MIYFKANAQYPLSFNPELSSINLVLLTLSAILSGEAQVYDSSPTLTPIP